MRYSQDDARSIEMLVNDAINSLEQLRNNSWPITVRPEVFYNKCQEKVNRAIKEFEEFYKYAYEGYYKGVHNDYSLATSANRIAIRYNYMLDLCDER